MTKQPPLPTLERTAIPELDAAAEDYRAKRDTRMAQTKLEVEAKQKLLDLMKNRGLKDYRYEGENADGETVEFLVERAAKENVRVKTAKDTGDEEEEGEEEAD